MLERPIMRTKGFLPSLSCSENEDDSTGQGPSTQRRCAHPCWGADVFMPSPSYKSLQRVMSLVTASKGAVRTFKPTQHVGAACCRGRRRQRVTPLAWGAGVQRAEGRMHSPAGWKKRELLPPWEYPPEAFSFPFGKDERNTVHLLCGRVPVPPHPSSPSPSTQSPESKEPLARGVNKQTAKAMARGTALLLSTWSEAVRGISWEPR